MDPTANGLMLFFHVSLKLINSTYNPFILETTNNVSLGVSWPISV